MNTRKNLTLDLESARERLAAVRGKEYWRSLEELADTDAFRELVEREFPEQAAEWTDPLTRRRFLMLMGASLALAGLTGCSTRPAPADKIVPYVRAPEELIPGKPLFYATAMTLGGYAQGLLVESHEGRPTKVEGNPVHPASLGATDVFAQASILTLYDPDRSQTLTYRGQVRTWDQASATFRQELEDRQRPRKGAGLRLLTESISSPTLHRQIQTLLKEYPEARWHQYEPLHRDNVLAGAPQALGRPVHTYYDFTNADVVLSLDADFLSCGPGHLRYVRDFMARRRVRSDKQEMNRLYMLESTPTNTGAKADHRLALRAADIEGFTAALAAGLKSDGAAVANAPAGHPWIGPLARDLEKHRGRSLVIAGEQQPPVIHVLAHAMNGALGNVGKTVFYTEPVIAEPVNQVGSLRELVQDMAAGRVETLVILGGNPVFTAPADLPFAQLLNKVPLRIHLSLYQDETSRLCHWHIPEAHYLESWGDGRAHEGTASIMQPLIAPLYEGRSAYEVLAVLTNQAELSGYEIVRAYWREYWQRQGQSGDFEAFWETAVHDGVVAGTAAKTLNTEAQLLQPRLGHRETASNVGGERFDIVFRSDPTLYDGRFANNGWLQELPKPLTKLTWDNAVLLSPNTARDLGLTQTLGWNGGEHGQIVVDMVTVRYQDREMSAPAWIVPGHPDRSVTVHLGYGRTQAGRVGNGTGFNAYQLRTADAPWFGSGATITKQSEHYTLACTQYHQLTPTPNPGDRHAFRSASLAYFKDHPHFATEPDQEHGKEEGKEARLPLDLYTDSEGKPVHQYPGYKWGMVIDLTACTGCKACVTACQSENNIPVVGKEEVMRGREMHWLRIDRYYRGPAEDPETHFQPVPCMHCENAPCELVCPVGATVHSSDGLNDMVYNRCVGTRYCSNNCPYKVRRFNFLQYSDFTTESLKLLHNPNVTVRSRGVMEKCTYCVQRIRSAEIEAKKEVLNGQRLQDPQRPGVAPIFDGEVVTACQAACPAQAILFGDLNDPKSKVAQLQKEPLNYALLANMNTRPRTTYLAALRNPNPELRERT